MEIRSRDPLHAIAVIRINLCKSPAVKIDGAPFPEWHQPMEGENVHPGDGHIKAKRADLQLCSTTPTGAPCPPPPTDKVSTVSLFCVYTSVALIAEPDDSVHTELRSS